MDELAHQGQATLREMVALASTLAAKLDQTPDVDERKKAATELMTQYKVRHKSRFVRNSPALLRI